METSDDKNILIEQTNQLKIKHEQIKADMLKVLEANQILENQYKQLEGELYNVENEYMEVMKKLI